MKRRDFVFRAATFPLVLGIDHSNGVPLAHSADHSAVPSYQKDFPDMLLNYLAERLNGLSRRWDQERARITEPAQIEARNRFVREKLLEMIHGLPARTPLN